jgi:ribonuclease VapC
MILDTSAVVAMRMKAPGWEALVRAMGDGRVAIGSATLTETAIVLSAWLRFGKGNHPASLDFGDCLSYAAARLANEPLLFVGDDFAQTDIARP